MIRKVLIADDDQTLLKLLSKKFEKFSGVFEIVLAYDGISAVNILEKEPVSLVISDLQMPRLDGFALLSHIKESYPDIPVIIITAFGKPKSRDVILNQGAVEYIEKPIVVDELANDILKYLNKETEGGLLNNASLEMFIQLIEMELKTCTIRVTDKTQEKKGVLFFREGELVNARIGKVHGNEAAYKIFSWSDVSISIENFCYQKKRIIAGDLQAILLESMRLKDESNDDGLSLDEEDDLKRNPGQPPTVDGKNIHQKVIPIQQQTQISRTSHLKINEETQRLKIQNSPLKTVENMLYNTQRPVTGIDNIQTDSSWNNFIDKAGLLGDLLGCGNLKACFVASETRKDTILIPGNDIIAIELGPKSSREDIIKILTND